MIATSLEFMSTSSVLVYSKPFRDIFKRMLDNNELLLFYRDFNGELFVYPKIPHTYVNNSDLLIDKLTYGDFSIKDKKCKFTMDFKEYSLSKETLGYFYEDSYEITPDELEKILLVSMNLVGREIRYSFYIKKDKDKITLYFGSGCMKDSMIRTIEELKHV